MFSTFSVTRPVRSSQSRAKRSLISPFRRRLHKSLAFVNRLVFYAFIVTLPFDLRISVLPVSDSPVLVSWVCLLAALALWLPTKLIEPRRRWYWGWWYTIIPLGLLLFLHAPQPFTGVLLLVALYLFVVNELPERAYQEVGLAFAIAVFAQAAVALWQPVDIGVMDSAQGVQLMAVETFVPLGLVLASRRWVGRSAGLVVAALALAATLTVFPALAAGLLVTVSLMLMVWMAIRRQRMQLQLALLILTLVVASGVASAVGATHLELVASVGDLLHAWQPCGSGIVFLLALPPLAALTGEYLKKEESWLFVIAVPALFIALLAFLCSAYSEVLNSLGAWALWLGLIFSAALTFTSVISLSGLKVDAFDLDGDYRPVVCAWLIWSGLAVMLSPLLLFLLPFNLLEDLLWEFGCLIPLLFFLAALIGLSIIASPALGWIARLAVSFVILALGWMVGLAVAVSVKANLNIGWGGLVLMVAAVMSSLAVVAQSPQVMREVWPLVVGVLVATGAWRSQRMWTVALSASLIGACLLALTDPEAWLTVPQSALFVTVMALWVDKSNIPLELRV